MKTYLKIHSEVKITIGKNKSALMDFNRKRIEYIPNSMAEFINEYVSNNTVLETIPDSYTKEEEEILQEYISYLTNNEFGFITETPECFPASNETFHSSSIVSNALIDIRQDSKFDFETIQRDLNTLNCFHLELRFFDIFVMKDIEIILSHFVESALRSIHILIQFNEGTEEQEIKSLFQSNPKLTKIIISNSHKSEISNKYGYYIEHTKNNVNNEFHCGFVNSKYFNLDLQSYVHNKTYNSCLNGKVSIDSDGYIKNCPAMSKNYGHISTTSIKEVVMSREDFKRLWTIKKDDISVCQSCELRYICSDCRTFTENDELHSKPKHCTYEP